MRLLLALLLLAGPAAANLVSLDATTKSLKLGTSTTAATDYVVSYVDGTATTFVPGVNQGAISTATATAVLAAPAASTQRAVTRVAVSNKSTATQSVSLYLDVSGTLYQLTPTSTLAAGESLQVDNGGNVTILGTSGLVKTRPADVNGYNGFPLFWWEMTGGTSEAAGVRYIHAKDTGVPGAWTPGTPGLAGTSTNCGVTAAGSWGAGATIMGAHLIPNPATGSNYLTYAYVNATVAHGYEIYDVLWYNQGLVVSTLTAQTVNSPAWPARDNAGSSDGVGIQVGIYANTATTNVGAIAGTVMSYTNSEGTAGRTATMTSWPATGAAGTFVPFLLQAGDRGVRSVQTVTLTTSYAGGTIFLLALRPLIQVPMALANVGTSFFPQNPGIRLHNGSCLWLGYMASATTATTSRANLWVMER